MKMIYLFIEIITCLQQDLQEDQKDHNLHHKYP